MTTNNAWVTLLVGLVLIGSPSVAAQYSMRRTSYLVELEDTAHRVVVAIAPSAGNLTRTMTVNGRNLLGPLGIPFLAPWANRLDD